MCKGEVENKTRRNIKCLKSDIVSSTQIQNSWSCVSDMKSRDISQYVRHHNSCLRMNKTIVEKARCLRMNKGLAKNFQVEAMNMTCFLIKRLSIVALDMKIEEEV